MITASPRYVVDASVGAKLYFEEDQSEHAIALFSGLEHTPPVVLIVPDLFFVECANVLWKRVRRGECPGDVALARLRALRALGLPTYSVLDMMLRALQIAMSAQISAYDACYVALAEHLAIPVVTADERLVSALQRTPHRALSLASVAAGL